MCTRYQRALKSVSKYEDRIWKLQIVRRHSKSLPLFPQIPNENYTRIETLLQPMVVCVRIWENPDEFLKRRLAWKMLRIGQGKKTKLHIYNKTYNIFHESESLVEYRFK